ncbi:coiled coil protein [Fluoribacter dumoffii]|uniref:coiled coil protein n=1 Tax=Fluoribacter dumoffii TaxID=463 RepID=UPI002244D73B|nr:coiled coil protein [Fluoribacter dumoffii]MCW8387034.1 coiled coil protein [Fluoribacter dumoffii]MCW8417462.1 coiled coil protein [Fluoribacter dumoffii]MCW8454696.1 coiled coil protein [Fluoribacter dumoffii]MCW8461226.1 coiled coil protein [Fluoribacter dumoffii]MCW8484667.1 coiled coil protein [Fluoribacter dumoffii]
MSFLKHLWAILLGITLLPLRVLVNNAFYALGAVILGVVAALGIPIYLAERLKKMGISHPGNFLFAALAIFPITVLLSTIALVGLMSYLIYDTITNMLGSLWLGFKNGLFGGMDGFFNALDAQPLLNPVPYMKSLRSRVNHNPLIVVVRESLEIAQLQEKEPPCPSELLTDLQLLEIADLIKQLGLDTEVINSDAKLKLEALKTLYTQYEDLQTKLEDVRLALVDDDKSRIKDEMIAYNEVETPVLLVKQYKKAEKWHNVPAASYITDKETLLHLAKINPKHPLNNDLIKAPQPYNGMESRYIWYELSEHQCSSQELGEAAAEMRVLMKSLLSLAVKKKFAADLGTHHQTFFGAGGGAPDSESQVHTLQKGSYTRTQ